MRCIVGGDGTTAIVVDGATNFAVSLRDADKHKPCTCGKTAQFLLPCAHLLKVCAQLGVDYRPWIAPLWTWTEYIASYSGKLEALSTTDMPRLDLATLSYTPTGSRRKKRLPSLGELPCKRTVMGEISGGREAQEAQARELVNKGLVRKISDTIYFVSSSKESGTIRRIDTNDWRCHCKHSLHGNECKHLIAVFLFRNSPAAAAPVDDAVVPTSALIPRT
jgi:hypothetical protein